MGSAFGSLLLTGSKRKRDGDACACVDGTRNTQQNYQQVVLGPSGDHHNRTGREEHAEEEFKAAVHRKAEKRRRNGKRSSSEMDHCNTQQKGSLLDGRDVCGKATPHKGSYGGELFSQLTPEQKEEVRLKYLEKIDRTKKKRKVGLLLAYTGTNYPGLQINPGQRSIEAELEKALFLSGGILGANFGCPRKISWSRSARTDKGVHAIGNLISAKLLVRPGTDGCDELRREVNNHLPNDIRVLDVARLMSSFSAYTSCERRKYYYLMPAACLLPAQEVDPLLSKCMLSSGEVDKNRLSCIAQDLRNSRCTKSQLELLRSILQRYEGTHSYHNFTKGKLPTDASAKRFILSATVGEPEIHQGQQWIPLEYVGSSFMIHQIRKMTGLAIFICRGSQCMGDLENAFKFDRRFVCTAPSAGLYLGKLYFEGYDLKIRRTLEREAQPKAPEVDETRSELQFQSPRVLQEQETFRTDFIHSRIVQGEVKGNEFLLWLTDAVVKQ